MCNKLQYSTRSGVVCGFVFYPGFHPGLLICDPLRGQWQWNFYNTNSYSINFILRFC